MQPRTPAGKGRSANTVLISETWQAETVSYRHRYRCWLCKSKGAIEFEPDASEPSWTECHECGIDNEIPPGLYDRPVILPGNVPSRVF